jgi:hypothetical protein
MTPAASVPSLEPTAATVLHTGRGEWQFTALYSNTARAHQPGRVNDGVVIFFHRDRAAEGQRTVVTETRGPAAGRRVVRGREAERGVVRGGSEPS